MKDNYAVDDFPVGNNDCNNEQYLRQHSGSQNFQEAIVASKYSGISKTSVAGNIHHEVDAHTKIVRSSTNSQGEVVNRRTERTNCQIQMVIPPQLDFPGVLCVGISAQIDLPVYNPTLRWIRCTSEIISCIVNGVKVPSEQCPFSAQSRIMVGPKLTENIKIDFVCVTAGACMADMKISSTPVGADDEASVSFVSLQGFSEEPKLEIIADEMQVLDFGEVHHDCNRLKPFKIVNKGMSTVPLKMRICSSNSYPGLFTFSKANSSDNISDLVLENTTLKCLAPAFNNMSMKTESVVIWIEVCGKNHHFEKSDDPVVVSAGVNIQLDTEKVAKILGNVQLSVAMGFTNIKIPVAFQMAMCLSTSVGKKVTREFPFTNAGNISAHVELTVPKHLDVFTVAPNKFIVKPGMAVMVKVAFIPKLKDTYESVIEVFEPDNNKCYEVLLRGSAVEPEPKTEYRLPLLCNKSWLCWTGVALGNASHQRIFLLNESSEETIYFQARISGDHPDFEIQRMRSEFSKESKSTEDFVLRPKERMPIYILFVPSSRCIVESALVLKPNRGVKFQVPLYAYGGRSALNFLNLKTSSNGYDAFLGEVSLGRRNILKLTVKNTGCRAAFIKAVPYADFQIRLRYDQTHLSIVPSEFVLPERSSKELVLVYQPLQHDAVACQQKMKRVADILFYHGDEVLRRWFRRNGKSQPEFGGRGSENFLKHDDIQFDKIFQDENCIAEDINFPDLENSEQIFDSHISQTFIHLFGGEEKQGMDNLTDGVVMATPRKRDIEPETGASVANKNLKTAEIKKTTSKCFVFY
ncbi:centrosomal protein of 192 kDa-like [Xenia sp. Carnegie-2017]|uniref:centrosomal protein of 192 kDa-like n=1 Tax=Xenia sp. Carnegie-2017 TaxID=2897299 RepID=UPI001F03E39A|nr:centrosomal protein of 192 kDa-like [Xenia sp. Carnegie-2017]